MAVNALSQFLNIAIPIAVIILFILAIYKGFGVQIKSLLLWIAGLFGYGKEAVRNAVNDVGGYDIIYSR